MDHIIIIGGGAAGLMAALTARKNSSRVTIIERNDRIGRKILATGNGRCNYTNIYLDIDNYYGENPKFAYSALSTLDVYRTIDLFEAMGIPPTIEESGKVFPNSLQSSSMVDVFLMEIDRLGIEVKTESYVENINIKNGKFTLDIKGQESIVGDKLIVATGGMAMPNSGSDGNGYRLLEKLGHSIVKPLPGLVQLNLEKKGNLFKQVKGVKFPGKVKLYSDKDYLGEGMGDILFTDYGISGPPILDLSNKALSHLDLGKDVSISVEVIHTMDKFELGDYLTKRFNLIGERSLYEAMIGLIHKKLIRPIIKEINLNPDKKAANISKKEIELLSDILTSWSFKVIGSQGWKHAQVSSGGVDTREVDSSSMESKLIDNLYIVGELLDISGECGGFNLQWAWSSGYLAGMKASE